MVITPPGGGKEGRMRRERERSDWMIRLEALQVRSLQQRELGGQGPDKTDMTHLTSLLTSLVKAGCSVSALRKSLRVRSWPELSTRYWSVARTAQEEGRYCRLDNTCSLSGLNTSSSSEDEDRFLNQIEEHK